jgi:hypothetical protein
MTFDKIRQAAEDAVLARYGLQKTAATPWDVSSRIAHRELSAPGMWAGRALWAIPTIYGGWKGYESTPEDASMLERGGRTVGGAAAGALLGLVPAGVAAVGIDALLSHLKKKKLSAPALSNPLIPAPGSAHAVVLGRGPGDEPLMAYDPSIAGAVWEF